MTLVRIALDVPGSAGNVRAVGRVRATPTLRRTVGDTIVLPAPFSAALVLGVATVELAPTAANWCWRIEELTAASATRYVVVPDSELTLGYEDLVDVDPATLDPTVEPAAAWTVALDGVADDVETLDGRVTVLEEAPPAAGGRFVLATTGDEPRPDDVFTEPVLWFDFRADRTAPLANMGPYDASLGAPVEEEEPPPSEAFSVYGAAAPTGSWSLGTDGTPYIVFGRGFYTFDSSDPTNGLPNGRVVGGRVWIPAGATGLPTEATFYLFGPAEDFDGSPVQTKVVDLAGVAAGDLALRSRAASSGSPRKGPKAGRVNQRGCIPFFKASSASTRAEARSPACA